MLRCRHQMPSTSDAIYLAKTLSKRCGPPYAVNLTWRCTTLPGLMPPKYFSSMQGNMPPESSLSIQSYKPSKNLSSIQVSIHPKPLVAGVKCSMTKECTFKIQENMSLKMCYMPPTFRYSKQTSISEKVFHCIHDFQSPRPIHSIENLQQQLTPIRRKINSSEIQIQPKLKQHVEPLNKMRNRSGVQNTIHNCLNTYTRRFHDNSLLRRSLLSKTNASVGVRFSSSTSDRQGDSATNIISLSSAVQLKDRQSVQVNWSTGNSSLYPWLWLRDNCQCQDCFHPVSLSRTFMLKDLQLDIEPGNTQIKDGELHISWSDGHTSRHGEKWLHQRAFEGQQRASRDIVHKLPRQYWKEELQSVDWTGLLTSDEALLEWLMLLETYGLVLVSNAPKHPACVRLLANRVAFVKRTHYGKDFSVIAKPNPSNVAYSNTTLALHLDLPYYYYKPGVQFIHCVQQYEGDGGDSQVSDALQVAEHMRKNCPSLYELLTNVPVDWVDHATEEDQEYFKALKMPVICLEQDRKSICRINFSQPQRDSFFSECPPDDITKWYHALKIFHDLLYDTRFCKTFKMESGSLMTLDNIRVTHGRTGYPVSSSGGVTRHIEGCYLDWDEVRSKRRVLQQRYGTKIY